MFKRTNWPGAVRHKIVLGLVCLSVLGSSSWLAAATKSERRRAAEQLVQEALHREIYGLDSEREQLLKEASEQAPDYAPAMWHRGFVRLKNEWVKATDVPQWFEKDQRIAQYHTVRGKYPDTPQGQLELANWCDKRGLHDQMRAHLMRVIQLVPNHAEARIRLGFRLVGDEWMHVDDVAEAAEALHEERKSLETWRPEVEAILKGLSHRSELRRRTAEEKLAAIRDVNAIPALEAILAVASEQTALMVVQTVANMPQNEAALSLARLAVTSPWPAVRDQAAVNLKDREKDVYVPALLSVMYTPIESRFDVVRGERGRLLYRHTFFREGQDENQLLNLDTQYRRVGRDPIAREDSLQRAVSDAVRRLAAREMSVIEQNRRTAELNARVMQALTTATGVQIANTPDSWWNWWTGHNEVFVQGSKQTRTVARTQEVDVVDRFVSGVGVDGQSLSLDCLAAGTSVWTATGPVAIEKIQVGDLVLSQDPETGELAYKPVLRTTVRPASALVRMRAGGETIETSGGHPFWVSGEGWIKAREVQPGLELHSISSTVLVQSVERIEPQETYNLIVADFNTYFVGDAKVLSHDNSIRQPTDAIVPGLAR